MNPDNPDGPVLRHPDVTDALAIWELVTSTPPLDTNSPYLYAVLAGHFSRTCLVAETGGELVGAVTGFTPPEDPRTLFVWQVAVRADHRGRGLAARMLRGLLAAQPEMPRQVTATVSPGNDPSLRLFAALARELHAPITVRPHLSGEHLGPAGIAHPDEDLVTIGPIGETA